MFETIKSKGGKLPSRFSAAIKPSDGGHCGVKEKTTSLQFLISLGKQIAYFNFENKATEAM